MIKNPVDVLTRIAALPAPRHFSTLPTWAPPGTLDWLIAEGYLTCASCQRAENGKIVLARHLKLTPTAKRLVGPTIAELPRLILKASAAGASLTVMSLLVLYLG